MEDKKLIRGFNTVVLAITVVTFGLAVFFDSAFIPSCMLMLALFLFGMCFYIRNEKKIIMYILFVIGVLLIIASLGYVYMRFING